MNRRNAYPVNEFTVKNLARRLQEAEKMVIGLKDELRTAIKEQAYWKKRAKLHDDMSDKSYWIWQGDGLDYPESLVCFVLIGADDLRAILARGKKVSNEIPGPWGPHQPCVFCGNTDDICRALESSICGPCWNKGRRLPKTIGDQK